MANSTTVRSIGVVTNGTSKEVALFSGTSPATTTTEYQDMYHGFAVIDSLSIYCSIGSPTGAAVDVYVQNSCDGVTWYDYIHFTQSAGAASAIKYLAVPALSGSIATIGSGTVGSAAPVLSSGSMANGPWHDWLRVVIKTAGNNTACAIVVNALCTRRPFAMP